MAAKRTIVGHALYFLFEVRHKTTIAEPLSAATVAATATSITSFAHAPAHPDRIPQGPAWTGCQTLRVADDLAPSLLVALGSDAQQAVARRFPVWQASEKLLGLINGRYVAPPGRPDPATGYSGKPGLRITIGAAEAVLRADSLSLLTWPEHSGALGHTSLAVLKAGLQADHTDHLLEALHTVSHDSRDAPLNWAAEPSSTARFRLSALMRGVLGPLGGTVPYQSRIYTYVIAQAAENTAEPELARLSRQLSRHYTDRYQIAAGVSADDQVLCPFDNVAHAASMEGAATVVRADTPLFRSPEFLAHSERTYLPLALAAYHEHILLAAIVEAALTDPHAVEGKFLRQLQRDYLTFRMRYSIPLVGQISMHNSWYSSMCVALKLPLLARKIESDLALVSQELAARARAEHQKQASHRERRLAWLQGFLAGSVAFLTCVALIKEVSDLTTAAANTGLSWPRVAALLAAALLAVIAGIAAGWRHAGEHNHPSDRRGDADAWLEEAEVDIAREAAATTAAAATEEGGTDPEHNA